jgi:hypothetical protein
MIMKRRFASQEESTPYRANSTIKNVKLFTHCCSKITPTDDKLTFKTKNKGS